MNQTLTRVGLLVLAAALAACQATAAGTIAPATPSNAPAGSAAPSSAPSATPSAVPSSAASAVPTSNPSAAAAIPVIEGVASYQGKPVSGWKLTLADATTDAAVKLDAVASTTDAKGNFSFRAGNLGEGDALRATLTAPDGKQAVAAIFTAADAEAPASYVLLHAGHHQVDEVTTAVEALQRGVFRAMKGLPKEQRRSLMATVRDGSNGLKAKLEAAFKAKPALATSALTKPGSSEADLDGAVRSCFDAAGVRTDAADVVGQAVAAIQKAWKEAAAGQKRPAVGETFLFGTGLKFKQQDGADKPELTDGKTGKQVDAADAGAVKGAGTTGGGGTSTSSGSSGGSGGVSEQIVKLRFAGMIGDHEVVTSGPTASDGASTYADVGSDDQTVRVMDLRFYIHDIALIDEDGGDHDLRLDENDWQYEDLALIDLDTGTTEEHNDTAIGRVPKRTYTGVSFKVGVPRDLNHVDKTKGSGDQKAPHEILAWDNHATSMGWSWMLGRKYAKIELATTGDAPKKLVFHLGGTGATNPTHPEGTEDFDAFDPTQTTLANPNIATVKLTGFDPTKETIAVDLQAFLANVILHDGGSFMPTSGGMHGYQLLHGAGNASDLLLKNMGIGGGSQKLFHAPED